MPATPIRRPRALASIAAAVLGLALLAGCTGQQTPGSYSDSVERNFVRGCTTTAEGDGISADDAEAFCTCVYGKLSAEDGVDFDEFKQVNDDQIENPGPLPDSFTKAYDDCALDGETPAGSEDGVTEDSEPGSTTTTEG